MLQNALRYFIDFIIHNTPVKLKFLWNFSKNLNDVNDEIISKKLWVAYMLLKNDNESLSKTGRITFNKQINSFGVFQHFTLINQERKKGNCKYILYHKSWTPK